MNYCARYLFAILFCAVQISAAAADIALISDSGETRKIADLTVTQNSGDLVFLERSDIERILKEHKLRESGLSGKGIIIIAKILHADIIAILNSSHDNKKTTPSSLRIFNAKNGFCLFDAALPPGIEEAAGFTGKQLKLALKKLVSKNKVKYVSILTVRNAGAPTKYRRRMEHIAMCIERGLIAMPELAVLERSELGMVSRERNISREQYALSPSAQLLDIEFSPAESSEKINLNIYVLDITGRELSRFTFRDCLRVDPDEILKRLAAYFKTAPPGIKTNIRQEAGRFFRQYKFHLRLKEYRAARSELESVIALEPDKLQYRRELMNLISQEAVEANSRFGGFDESIKAAYEVMKIDAEIKKEFPGYTGDPDGLIRIPYGMSHIWSNMNYLSAKQKLAAKKMLDQLRPKFLEGIKRLRYPFDLSDGINSPRELSNYDNYLRESSEHSLYFDYDASMKRHLEIVVEILNAFKEYNRNHSPKTPRALGFMPAISKDFFPAFDRQIKSPQALAAINAAVNYPDKKIKRYGYLLAFYRKCALNNYDKEKFSEDIDNLYKQAANLNSGKKPLRLNFHIYRFHKADLYRISEQKAHQILTADSTPGSWEAMLKKLKAAGEGAVCFNVIEYADELQKWRRCDYKQNRHDLPNTPARFLHDMANRCRVALESGRENAELMRETLAALNKPVSVRLVKKVLKKRYRRFQNAVLQGDTIFMLAVDREDISIFSFNIKKKTLKECVSYKNVLSDKALHYRDQLMRPFFVDENYFVIGGVDRIFMISRNNNSLGLIEDLPAENVRAIAVFNERLYAFAGRKLQKNVFFSCKPDGTERKIHISTVRRDKQNLFDKRKYFVQAGLFVDGQNKSLLFAADGLWEFFPEKNVFRKRVDFNKPDYYLWANRIADKIYIASAGNYRDHYVYDMAKNTLDFVYFDGHEKETKYLKNKRHKPRCAQWLNLWPPFLLVGDLLWGCGYGAGLIDLKEINGKYCIHGLDAGMPGSGNILFFPYPGDKHSVYAVSGQSIYQLTMNKFTCSNKKN